MKNISQKWRLDTTLYNLEPEVFCQLWLKNLLAFCFELQQGSDLVQSIQVCQEMSQALRQFSTLAHCLFSEDVANNRAQSLVAKGIELDALFQKASAQLESRLLKEPDFDTLLKNPLLKDLQFALTYARETLREKMNLDKEALVTDLSINGYHSWNELYKQSIGKMQIKMAVEGIKGSFSLGQIDNFLSHPVQKVRKSAFKAIEKACIEQENVMAQALRSIYGYRSQLYRHRGWQNPLHEALRINNLQETSLNTMWAAIDRAAPIMQRFLGEKAKILGLKKLSWFDLEAPHPEASQEFSYETAANFIVEQFTKANKELGDFALMAFEKGWIEAENRPGKAPGGFCAPLPATKESRIFMSYSNSMQNMLTLAHELGHAYHNHVCFELPEMAQKYPMSLAECASTTCELIVLDALIANAKTRQERKRYLYEKIQHHTVFFLNIRARFLFEQHAMAEAQKGYITPQRLCELMQEAQKSCYGERLASYHPYFWVSKMHFYFTEVPSYNFPYSFGYILSLAINAKAKDNPSLFGKWYKDFLQDTARASCEDLVQKHFGRALSEPLFWQQAIDPALAEVEEFLAL